MKKKVLVIGDVVTDRYVHGIVDRTSPEAPTTVLNVTHEARWPGGAAQVALTARAHEVPVGIMYLRGPELGISDIEADLAGNAIAARGVWTKPVIVVRYRTPVRNRFISQGQQLLRCDEECEAGWTDQRQRFVASRLGEAFRDVLREVGVLVLVDHGFGALNPHSTSLLIQVANREGIPVIFSSTSGNWPASSPGITVLVTSWKESLARLNMQDSYPAQATADAEPAADVMTKLIAGSTQCQHAVITCGAQGLFWRGSVSGDPAQCNLYHLKAKVREMRSPVSARNVLLGALAAEMLHGTDITEALIRANAAAGIAVSLPSAAIISRLDVERDLRWTPKGPRKVTDLNEARSIVERYKANGQPVGFLFGEFHQLRPGHVRFINRAKEECGFLVAGVKEVKNETANAITPWFQVFGERLEVLANLEGVDLVVPIPDDDVEAVVRELRPDKLFITERHEGGKVADIVSDRGGSVIVFPRM